MTTVVDSRTAIAARLVEARGKRSAEIQAAKMGITRARLSQMEQGQIPNAWLYLARLLRDGVSIDWLLRGE